MTSTEYSCENDKTLPIVGALFLILLPGNSWGGKEQKVGNLLLPDVERRKQILQGFKLGRNVKKLLGIGLLSIKSSPGS